MQIFSKHLKNKNQQGIASIIIVSVLVILLSLVSIGFSRLVNRDASSALQDQKALIASYAAESGINQVINYINQGSKLVSKNLNNCQNNLLKKLNSNTGLSGDKTTEYTCILLNLNPTDLSYSLPQPLQSKTIKLTAPAPFTSVFLSWASSGNATPAANGSQDLLDEHTWNAKNYMPMMRVSVYATPPNNQFSGPGYLARTFFLYPSKSSGSNIIDLTGSQAAADGALMAVNCQARSFSNFSYVSPGQQYCSVIFDAPPAGDSKIYLRLTPLYGPAKIYLKAQTAAGDVTFKNNQAVVDATAKSNDVVKRLQARVALTGNQGPPETDALPEFALRSAGTLCKRFVVPGFGDPFIDPASVADCFKEPAKDKNPPPVAVTLPATAVTASGATLNGTVRPNAPAATYYFEYAPGASPVPGETLTAIPAKPGNPLNIYNGTLFDYPVSQDISLNLSGGNPYHFRVCGVNSVATACGQYLSFVYNSGGGGGGCASDVCLQITYYGCGTVAHSYDLNNILNAYGPGVPAPGKQIGGGFIAEDKCTFPTPWVTRTIDLSNLGFTSAKGIVLKASHGKLAIPTTFKGMILTAPGQSKITPVFHYDNPSSCNVNAPPRCPPPFPLYLNNPSGGTATSNPS